MMKLRLSWRNARRMPLISTMCGVCMLAMTTLCHGQLTLSGGGLTLAQEGPVVPAAGDPVPDNIAQGGIPFAHSELGPEIGVDFHLIDNLNDGAYGNAFSWIGGDDIPYDDIFAGIDLGATPVNNLQAIAFGRSNVLGGDACGVCTDRHMGLYTLQYTQVARPSNNLDLATTGVPTTGWVDVGTLDYGASEGLGTNYNSTWLRHVYNFDPVSATGIRLLVPSTGLGGGTAIDEIELYNTAQPIVEPPPAPDPIVIDSVSPFNIAWDGNDGDYFDPLEPPDGSLVPFENNLALAVFGGEPFSSSDLGPELGIEYHVVDNINDGFYGNANSWIGGDNNPYAPIAFAGVSLPEPVSVTSIAWGRDNGNDFTDACGGQCSDRSLGTYTLQFTQVFDPDADTPETGDPATGWQTMGTVTYSFSDDTFTPFYRHEFDVDQDGNPILATGIRLIVPANGIAGGTAIDELEIYGTVGPVNSCDLNGDGICDVQDIDDLTAVVVAGTDDLMFDLDRNGEVNQEDRRIWVEERMNTWYGDANLDGEFNSSDFVKVFQAGTYESTNAGVVSWGEGDWNGDTRFNTSDFVLAFQSGGYEMGPREQVAAVPEPSSLLLLFVAFAWLTNHIGRRRSLTA